MCKSGNNRRISSILRDNLVHDIYREEIEKLGVAGRYVSKEYLYNKVRGTDRPKHKKHIFHHQPYKEADNMKG